MENASKALIIAGAILLSISIIGIGMYVFQQAQGAMDGIGMDKEKANAYNGEFLNYTGEIVNGTKVRQLVDIVRQHNIQTQSDESLKITINGSADNLSTYKNTIKAGKSYKVEVTDDGFDKSTGYIKNITITEKQ